jgi:hypothetical protein
MKLSLGAVLIVAATTISGGSTLTSVSAVAASKLAENSQSPRATEFSAAQRYYRQYRRYGYSPRYYRPRYYGSYPSYGYPGYYGGYGYPGSYGGYGYPGYYGGYGYGGPSIGFSFGF